MGWKYFKDNWRKHKSYPQIMRLTTGGPVGGGTTSTYYNKGNVAHHVLTVSLQKIFFSPHIFAGFLPINGPGCLVALFALVVFINLNRSVPDYRVVVFLPALLLVGYCNGVFQNIDHLKSEQAKRERGTENIVYKRPDLVLMLLFGRFGNKEYEQD